MIELFLYHCKIKRQFNYGRVILQFYSCFTTVNIRQNLSLLFDIISLSVTSVIGSTTHIIGLLDAPKFRYNFYSKSICSTTSYKIIRLIRQRNAYYKLPGSHKYSHNVVKINKQDLPFPQMHKTVEHNTSMFSAHAGRSWDSRHFGSQMSVKLGSLTYTIISHSMVTLIQFCEGNFWKEKSAN